MKKLLSIIFATIMCIPGYTYADCAQDVKAEYNLLYNFDADTDYQHVYAQVQAEETEKLNTWKEQTNTGTRSGRCNSTPYECKQGQKNKDCVPETCWTLLANVKEDIFLENEAQDRFINKKISERCGNTVTEKSTVSNTPTSQNTAKINIQINIVDENNEPLIGASVIVVGTNQGVVTDLNGNATLPNVSNNAQIKISYVGYKTQTLPAQSTMSVHLVPSNTMLENVEVAGCRLSEGVKTVKCINCQDPDRCSTSNCSGKCVPDVCLTPQYTLETIGDSPRCVDQVGKPCDVKHATSAKYEMQNGELVCVVTECDKAKGYQKSSDNRSCTKDCLSSIKSTVPLATKAEYNETGECEIKKCGEQNGKEYIPSDNKKSCEVTERPCDKEKDKAIWPDGATAAAYKKGKCYATECEPGYDGPNDGKCVSVNDSDCDKKPENSKKSHRYYDASTKQTLCLVDECKKGYKRTNDMLSCILESALSDEDAKKRMDELKENEQKMKERENSIENKLLGAAGIGAVGIGGMNIASALSEKSADQDAEQDMKAYLATFRCDYGQGRNIVGGETNIQLPGASELIQYTTEYKQIAANLKTDKEALGMLPGIESEVVFDSATTGLYDDVSIGIQKGAFTSLSRALLDENSADAAEWQAQKDATAKKLKTGAIVAGVGAIGTLAGNIAINHGKGDKSDSILDKYEPLKQEIPDITLPRIPCSQYPDTTGTGYVPNCECQNNNAYFDEKEMKCTPCGTNEHVNDAKNACECNQGFHRDSNGNCIENKPNIMCEDFPDTNGGTYSDCHCKDDNATFNPQHNKCECKENYSNPNGGQCLPTCVGLPDVNKNTASQYNVPNCPCEYSGATFDQIRNGCYCPQGQHEDTVDGQKKCIQNEVPRSCNGAMYTNGGEWPNCTCIDPNNATFNQQQNKCECKNGRRMTTDGHCVEDTTPIINASFSSDTTFDRSAHEISDNKCSEIINAIKQTPLYQTNANRSGTLCISTIGHTDTKWFRNTAGVDANRQKNQQLSEQRAQAMYNCISRNIHNLFPNATIGSHSVIGKNWEECRVQTQNKDTPACRKVELKIQPNRCTN